MVMARLCPRAAKRAIRAIPQELRAKPAKSLDRLVAAGTCAMPGADPEDWYPLAAEAPALGPSELAALRATARQLCDGCVSRAACLELAMRRADVVWGIRGGLAPCDRAAARQLWTRLASPTPASPQVPDPVPAATDDEIAGEGRDVVHAA